MPLNKKVKVGVTDEIPLIEEKNNNTPINDVKVDILPSDDEDDESGKPLTNRDIRLWISDAIILIIEHLQYYAILLVLSERWGWPVSWVNATAFTLIFNFDIWEFRKVESGAFNHSRVAFIDTSKIGFNYMSYLASWGVILCIICCVFGVIYYRWMRRRPLYLLLLVARWKRIMFLVFQIIAIPFGVAAARIFHCRKDTKRNTDVMDIQNEYTCYSATHISLLSLFSIIFVGLYVFYPMVLRHWIKMQVFSGEAVRHEGYLQLKEAEYEQGLDMSWEINQYHLFSSYSRFWIYYNPLKFIYKLLVIIAFAASVNSTFWSSACITILFALASFACVVKRPFRVRVFNYMIAFSHLVIASNCLVGNFMVRPPWEDPEKFQIVAFLRPPSISNILLAINLGWFIFALFWIFYLILLNNGLKKNEGVWPRLSYESSNKIGEDTKKYLKAALKARQVLEKALSAIPLFAPIHELAHEIKVINAFCREAECIEDPTHDTLWDLLDELIEAHNSLVTISVFGLSGKSSVKETSEEFIKLMPSFRKRLKQREYDFILMSPVKRRLLLKMFIISTFFNNCRKNRRQNDDVTQKLEVALLMFDTKSIGDSDIFLNSTRQSSRGLVSQALSSRPESSVTHFLADIDRNVPSLKNAKSPQLPTSKDSTTRPSSQQSDWSFSDGSSSASSGKRSAKSRRPKITFTSSPDESERPNTAPLSPLPELPSLAEDRPGTAPDEIPSDTNATFLVLPEHADDPHHVTSEV